MGGSQAPTRGIKFLGSHEHALDEKGRVSLPAPFRREAADQRFVLVQPYPPALALYPESEWMEVERRLTELVGKNPKARMYVLSVVSNAVEVALDGQGRILIPQRFQEAAKLSGSVMVVGAIDKVELWNPDQFKAAVASDGGEFAQFTAQVFR